MTGNGGGQGGHGGFPFPGGGGGGGFHGFPGGFSFSHSQNFDGGGGGMEFDGNIDDMLSDLFDQLQGGRGRRRRSTRDRGDGGGDFFAQFGQQRGRGQPQPPELQRDVVVTLEELFHGTTKTVTVRQDVVMDGRQIAIERTFEIEIAPGWKSGTKIAFGASRNFPAKVVFKLVQARHKFIERLGDDLYWKCHPLEADKVKKGVVIKIPNVDGTEIIINTKHMSLKNGSKKVFSGLGMPISKSMGALRGDFIVKFEIVS